MKVLLLRGVVLMIRFGSRIGFPVENDDISIIFRGMVDSSFNKTPRLFDFSSYCIVTSSQFPFSGWI